MARRKKTAEATRLAAIAAVNKNPAKEESKMKPGQSQIVENNDCRGWQAIPRQDFEDIIRKQNDQAERIVELQKRVEQLEKTRKQEHLEVSQVKRQVFEPETTSPKEQEVNNPPPAKITPKKRETSGYFETVNFKKEQLFNEFARKKSVDVESLRKAGSLAAIVTGSIREPQINFASRQVAPSKRLKPALRRSFSNNSIDAIQVDSPDSFDLRRHSAGRNAVNMTTSRHSMSGSAVDLRLARESLVKVSNKKVEDDIFFSSIREEGPNNMGLESDC